MWSSTVFSSIDVGGYDLFVFVFWVGGRRLHIDKPQDIGIVEQKLELQ